MMLDYLQNNIFSIFNNERPKNMSALVGLPVIIHEDTCNIIFDLADPKGKSNIKYIVEGGGGQVTYHNNQKRSLRIINYEAFVNFFTVAHVDKKGRSRVDFIVYDTDSARNCFILNELSEGSVQNKLSKARLQLQNTLHDLFKDPEVKSYILSFNQKQCVLSCRRKSEPASPLDMAAAFGMANQIIPENSRFSAKSVERNGFECIENDHIEIK